MDMLKSYAKSLYLDELKSFLDLHLEMWIDWKINKYMNMQKGKSDTYFFI